MKPQVIRKRVTHQPPRFQKRAIYINRNEGWLYIRLDLMSGGKYLRVGYMKHTPQQNDCRGRRLSRPPLANQVQYARAIKSGVLFNGQRKRRAFSLIGFERSTHCISSLSLLDKWGNIRPASTFQARNIKRVK